MSSRIGAFPANSPHEFLRLAEESGVVVKDDLDLSLQSLADRGVELNDASTLANSLVSSHTLPC